MLAIATSSVTFQVESWSSILPCMKHLMRAHWAENAMHKDEVPLDPDWDAYARMERLGVLECVTVRDSVGLVVGYLTSSKRVAASAL